MCITSLNMPKMCKLTICTYMQENHMHKYSQICIFNKKAQTCVFKMCIICTYMCYMIEHSRRKICHSMQIKICKNLNWQNMSTSWREQVQGNSLLAEWATISLAGESNPLQAEQGWQNMSTSLRDLDYLLNTSRGPTPPTPHPHLHTSYTRLTHKGR